MSRWSDDRCVTVNVAATILGVSVESVRRMISEGALTAPDDQRNPTGAALMVRWPSLIEELEARTFQSGP